MAERGTVRTYNPEYGSLRTLLLVGALAGAIALSAPAVAGAVGFEPVEYALYGVAAVVVLAAFLLEASRQAAPNPHEFVARDVLAQFYDRKRPTPLEHLRNILVAGVGAGAVVRGAEPALSRQEGALLIVERVAAQEPLPAIDPVNVAWGVVLLTGVVMAAVGVDRLLVGVYRELQFRRANR